MSLSFPPQSSNPMTILDSSNGCDKYLDSTVLILNMPYSEGEDLPALLVQLAQMVGVKVDPHEDINRIYRMGPKLDAYSPMAVQFRNAYTCNSLNKHIRKIDSKKAYEMRPNTAPPGMQNFFMKNYLGKKTAKVYRRACELYDQGEFACVYDFNCQIYVVKYIEGQRCTIWLENMDRLESAKVAKDVTGVRVIPERKTAEKDTHRTAVILGIPYAQGGNLQQIVKEIMQRLRIDDDSSSTLDWDAILSIWRTDIDNRRPRIEVVFDGVDQKLAFISCYKKYVRKLGQLIVNDHRVVINMKLNHEFADIEKIAHRMKEEHLIEDVFYMDNNGVYVQIGPLEQPLLITNKLVINQLKIRIMNNNRREIYKQAEFFCREKFISNVWCDREYIFVVLKPDAAPLILHCSLKEWNVIKNQIIETGAYLPPAEKLPHDIILRAIFNQLEVNISNDRVETTKSSQVSEINQQNEICLAPSQYKSVAVFRQNDSLLDARGILQQFKHPVNYFPIGPPRIITHFPRELSLVEKDSGGVCNNSTVHKVDCDPNLRARFVQLAIKDYAETPNEDRSLIYSGNEQVNHVHV